MLRRDEAEAAVAGEVGGEAGAPPLLVHHRLELVALMTCGREFYNLEVTSNTQNLNCKLITRPLRMTPVLKFPWIVLSFEADFAL